jgi:DNA-binding MarR family transcriptional regulator
MDNELKYRKVIDTFSRVLYLYGEMEKKPRDYGTGDLLFTSEIHTIEAIGENPGINITALSDKLGISKSAVSQIINKLEIKQIVTRYKQQNNGKEVLLKLLERGQLAFYGHKKYHLSMDVPLIEAMADWDDKQVEFLSIALNELFKYGERVMAERARK